MVDRDATAIGDVKYKTLEKREDLNQFGDLCLVYRVPTVIAILPVEAGEKGLSTIGSIGYSDAPIQV
jgi:hypothetical protein